MAITTVTRFNRIKVIYCNSSKQLQRDKRVQKVIKYQTIRATDLIMKLNLTFKNVKQSGVSMRNKWITDIYAFMSEDEQATYYDE